MGQRMDPAAGPIVSSDYLDTVYKMATATGAYAAAGTTSGQWMASIVTLKTS